MFRDIRKNKIFNRRTLIVSSGQGALTTILLARLSYLQIFKHKEYTIQSNSNSIKPIIKPAPRALIKDRKNRDLSQNKRNYRLYLYLEDKKDMDKLVNNLTNILDLNQNTKNEILTTIKKSRKRTTISLLDKLSWDDVARLTVNSYRLPGTSIESEFLRFYPYPHETAHFLGYVSLPNDKEINAKEKALYLHPSFRIGKTGLEKSFDKTLRGKYGVEYVEVNSLERPIRTISVKESQRSSDLKTTIDIDLQQFATKQVQNKTASIVVMNVKSGEILSYVSSPNFNGNNFVEGISQEYWQTLRQDKQLPLNNRPISAMYPPGSTFKLMTALAALEDGFDPNQKYTCKGHHYLGKRRFHCWEEKGHGKLNLIQAIERSCNIYFYNIAQRIGIDKISAMARRFGYGQKVNINLLGSKSGNIPSNEWKKKIFHQSWVGGDTLNASIGQGFVLATPIQIALATCKIANGGVNIEPFLIKSPRSQTQFEKLAQDKIVKQEHLAIIKEGMTNVVNKKTGSAYWRRIYDKGFEMAGKTGTSQVVSKRRDEMTRLERRNSSNKNHAIFTGYAPINDPKYAISVVVEHGGSGSYAAAPIARDVLLKAQKLDLGIET